MHATQALTAVSLTALLGACSSMAPAPRVDNAALPEAVRAPMGQKASLHTVGKGDITYECRAKAAMPGAFEWVFVAPLATLADLSGRPVGRYYGGPTWEAGDGSKLTGKQVAVAPASPGNIPLQLVKAEPAMGMGAMQGVTYIQRLNTRGGVAPSDACDGSQTGARRVVPYQADYVFYRAG